MNMDAKTSVHTLSAGIPRLGAHASAASALAAVASINPV
jgi:hypothetical protein